MGDGAGWANRAYPNGDKLLLACFSATRKKNSFTLILALVYVR